MVDGAAVTVGAAARRILRPCRTTASRWRPPATINLGTRMSPRPWGKPRAGYCDRSRAVLGRGGRWSGTADGASGARRRSSALRTARAARAVLPCAPLNPGRGVTADPMQTAAKAVRGAPGRRVRAGRASRGHARRSRVDNCLSRTSWAGAADAREGGSPSFCGRQGRRSWHRWSIPGAPNML